MPNHTCILEYQWSTLENLDEVQMTNFTEKKKRCFFDRHLTLRDKMKIPKPCCTFKRHSQSYPRVPFVCSMKCKQSSNYNNFNKNVIFWPLIGPWGKNENSKTLLHICKT